MAYSRFKKLIKPLIPKQIFNRTINLFHLLEAVAANIRYGFPARKLKIIGVTGTNGKTTTVFMIHKLLSSAGIKTGIMSTVAYGIDDDIHPQIQHMTTVDSMTLMKRLRWMKRGGADYVVLEVTSHALAQNRVWGIPFSVAVLTNLTHEHLDYHGTFENYRDAKRKLFRLTSHNRHGQQVGIINLDDESFKLFAQDIKNPISYGLEKADVTGNKLKLTSDKSVFNATTKKATYEITCNLPGKFNVYNALSAVAIGEVLGLNKSQIEQGIGALHVVEGRMTKIDEGQPFTVIVDFAHTPDSFEKLLSEIKPTVKGRLLVMFGSAGRRDESKRQIQGKIAGRYADLVVITEEDDRDIDGNLIMRQIAEGAIASGKLENNDLYLIHNREEAIKFVLCRAGKGDTVMLLGKGHEKTIERAGGEEPWDEIKLTHETLKSLSQD